VRSRHILYSVSLVFVLFCVEIGCRHVTEPGNGPSPPDNIPVDYTLQAGNYIVLDRTQTPGHGQKLTYFWTPDKSNPDSLWALPNSPTQTFGFTKEGIYRFYFVFNDGVKDSETDTIVVKVLSRNEILFEDPKLEMCVRWRLKAPTGALSGVMLQSLDSLQCVYFADGVSSLRGLEQCKNLEWLWMSLQRISEVTPLAGLGKLHSIELDQNRVIRDISALAGLTGLKRLNLMVNQISDITPLASLTNLKYLNLMENPVHDLSVLRNFAQLEELWLDYYSLPDISPLSALRQLRVLWMTTCQLSDITVVSTLTNLRWLVVGTNRITDISAVSNLVQLELLYIDGNQVVDISAIERLTQLRRLDLSNNRITNIEPLVRNAGLGAGDVVSLLGNPLDSASVYQHIPALKARGAAVLFRP